MSPDTLATDATKTALENSVNWFLADKIQDASIPIATKKYLTNQNVLVYLTRCNVAESSIARVKIQVLHRVPGGIHEAGYQIFSDHRLEKYQNDMIFGTRPGATPDSTGEPVSEQEAQELLALVNSLVQAQQTL